MFRTVPLSIIRNFSLYTQQWFMSYGFADSLRADRDGTSGSARKQDQDGIAVPPWSCSQTVSKAVWHIPLLCVQWKTPDDGQRNCPKHVVFYSKNKLEKLVHLVGFIIWIYHDARSPELRKSFGDPWKYYVPQFRLATKMILHNLAEIWSECNICSRVRNGMILLFNFRTLS